MKKLKCIISLMGAFVLAASFAGCSGDEKKSKDNNDVVYYDDSNAYVAPEDVEEEARKNAVTQTAEINQQAEIVGCDVNVKQVVSLGVRPADDIYDYDADMYAAEVEFTNNTEDTFTVSAAEDFYISVDGAEEVLGMNMSATLVAGKLVENYQTFNYEVAPGETVSGFVTFEAKTGWKEVVMSYTPLSENHNYDAVIYTITPDMVS